MKVKEVLFILYRLAPPELAMAGDAFGLQVGEPAAEVKKVLVCLTLTLELARAAVRKKIDLIVAHHPLISGPLGKIDCSDTAGKIIKMISAAGISFINLHTCLDVAPQGVSDCLAAAAGLAPEKCKVLLPVYSEKLFKLAVFVPESHTEKVFQALMAAGAGGIGKYDSCAFITSGMGTFRPLAGSRPFIGVRGRISRVTENKIETIVPEFILERVLAAMKAVHPYEEVAWDIFPLANSGRVYGLGRIGPLAAVQSRTNFYKKLSRKFPEIKVHEFSRRKNKIRRLAVVPGSGGSALNAAISQKADIFLTGELKYHYLLEARAAGLTVVEAGHEDSEKIVLPVLAGYLQEKTNLHIIKADK